MEKVLPKSVKNRFFFFVGILILVVNKIRHEIQGYVNPRPFPVTEIQKTIDYNTALFHRLQEQLVAYTKSATPFKEATVLELGPGPDNALALLALQAQAKKYCTLDVNNLAAGAPQAFYEELVNQKIVTEQALQELNKTKKNQPSRIQAVVDTDFDPRVFLGENIDLVISNAAFEHFDSVEATIGHLAEIMVSGGVFLADVDLQTHTRWIRDEDPLNIYRYGKILWNLLSFSGSPNRVRPFEYIYALEKNGFENIQLIPRIQLDSAYTEQVRPSLHTSFQQDEHLDILDFYVIATKK